MRRPMRWMAKKLRGDTVYARVDKNGVLVVSGDGRVEIIYKKAPGAKIYRASSRNLEDGPSKEIHEFDVAAPTAETKAKPTLEGEPIIIYTDGGARPTNPGPMGIGVVVLDGSERKEISEYLGHGTNNIAELTAIMRALESLGPDAERREVRIHTDSSYALGLLTKGWKAKKNKELVAELRAVAAKFPGLRMVKVKAHVGVAENERADQLATAAAMRRT